eukprot:COSAG05_NODE_2370_length_3162_cov_62.259876_4_plen_248_part_00
MPLDPRADSLLASFEDIKATLAGAAHACAFGVAAREGQIPAEGHTYQGLNADDAASLSAQQHLGRSIDPGPHAQQPHRYSSAATKGQELGAQTAAGTVGDGGRDAYRRQESVAGDAERSRKQQTVTPAARSTGDVIGRMVRERRHADSERAQRLAGAAALKEQTLRRRRELEEEAEVCVVVGLPWPCICTLYRATRRCAGPDLCFCLWHMCVVCAALAGGRAGTGAAAARAATGDAGRKDSPRPTLG